jgi:hypothetical protein
VFDEQASEVIENMVGPWGLDPLGRLFVGEKHATLDKHVDPNALFSARNVVAEIAETLNRLTKDYFLELFRSRDSRWTNEAWLYEPLRTFLSSAHTKGKAVIVIWEN